MILKFREDMKTFDVLDIAKNTSVKFVSQDGTKNYNPDSRTNFILNYPVQPRRL